MHFRLLFFRLAECAIPKIVSERDRFGFGDLRLGVSIDDILIRVFTCFESYSVSPILVIDEGTCECVK